MKPNATATVTRLVANGVQATPNVARLGASIMNLNLDTEPNRVRKAGEHHRRADSRGVWHGVSVECRALARGRAWQRCAGDIAGRDNEREPKGHLAAGVRKDATQD
jgi:hypothetical protein